jgi:hypothetical protein
MIKFLLLFILSCIQVSFYILRIAIVKALLPRMPPPNWGKEKNISVVQVDDVGRGEEDSRIIKLWKRGWFLFFFICMDRSSLTYIRLSPLSLGPGHDFANGNEEAARSEKPNPFTTGKYALLVDKVNVTPTKASSIVGFEFSLNLVGFLSLSLGHYNRPYFFFDVNHQDSAVPQDIRHPFLTPVRPSPPIKEIGFTVLRNASDRVTEILRENRRRLDAGEDPNTIRSTWI